MSASSASAVTPTICSMSERLGAIGALLPQTIGDLLKVHPPSGEHAKWASAYLASYADVCVHKFLLDLAGRHLPGDAILLLIIPFKGGNPFAVLEPLYRFE